MGTVADQTGVRMKLVSDRHGPGVRWCTKPSGKIGPHSSGRLGILGGKAAGASAHFLYRLRTGAEVELNARVSDSGREQTSCSLVNLAAGAHSYKCQAGVTDKKVTRTEHVVLTVSPSTGTNQIGRPPPQVGDSLGCAWAASGIVGSTVDQTSQTATLQQALGGVTNSWCATPADEQGPGTTSNWRVGDNFFGTSVSADYTLPGSQPQDEYEFDANIRFATGGGGATCGPVTNGVFPPSGAYTCKATFDLSSNPHYATVEFQLLNAS